MNSMRDVDGEEVEPEPFEGMDLSAVVQGCKVFNQQGLDPSKAIKLLTELQYRLSQGEKLTETEATEVFFSTTKLFEIKDRTLRRMVYITLKDLAWQVEAALIAVSVLVKDINSTDEQRGHAIRALRKVADDGTLAQGSDRFLLQAVLDSNTSICCAALVTGLHIAKENPEMVKRWHHSVTEVLSQRGACVQYPALALLSRLRKGDRMTVSRLTSGSDGTIGRSSMATCLLIRMCGEVLRDDPKGCPEALQFVIQGTRHANEGVVFEAARTLVTLPAVEEKHIQSVSMVLQLYLTSHRPVYKYAAVKTLNELAKKYPSAVATCNIDLEGLVADPNRNIATLAIATLLKSGNEYSIDRLMKGLTTFFSDVAVADEFKIFVVEAMQALSAKFPKKSNTILDFLSNSLRESGSYEFKNAAVGVIFSISESDESRRELGMLHLCEFIEDCEYLQIAQRVLHFLGRFGPSASQPSKYIRYINNRTLLEKPMVRAAAVTVMAKFAAQCPDLRSAVVTLISRCTKDTDEEVRDRAVFYRSIFQTDDKNIQSFIMDIASEAWDSRTTEVTVSAGAARTLLATSLPSTDDLAGEDQEQVATKACEEAAEEIQRFKPAREFGEILATSGPHAMTEADTEFVVTCFKHIYAEHVVFQYRVLNTLEDHFLEDVTVTMGVDIEGLEEGDIYPATSIGYNETKAAYCIFQKEADTFPTGEARTQLNLNLKVVGEEDVEETEYQMEDAVVAVNDYMRKAFPVNFGKEWEQIGELEEAKVTMDLSGNFSDLQAAMDDVPSFLGMACLGGTEKVPEKVKQHVAQLAGKLPMADGTFVTFYAKAKVFYSTENDVTLDWSLRGGGEELRDFVTSALC